MNTTKLQIELDLHDLTNNFKNSQIEYLYENSTMESVNTFIKDVRYYADILSTLSSERTSDEAVLEMLKDLFYNCFTLGMLDPEDMEKVEDANANDEEFSLVIYRNKFKIGEIEGKDVDF